MVHEKASLKRVIYLDNRHLKKSNDQPCVPIILPVPGNEGLVQSKSHSDPPPTILCLKIFFPDTYMLTPVCSQIMCSVANGHSD